MNPPIWAALLVDVVVGVGVGVSTRNVFMGAITALIGARCTFNYYNCCSIRVHLQSLLRVDKMHCDNMIEHLLHDHGKDAAQSFTVPPIGKN